MFFVTDVTALVVAVLGSFGIRRFGARVFWCAAGVLMVALLAVSFIVPTIELTEGSGDGLSGSGLTTQFFALAVLPMALILHAAAWRRIPKTLGIVFGVLGAFIAWSW